MTFEVGFTSEGFRSFEKIAKSVRQRIYRKLKWLSANVHFVKHMLLHGEFEGLYKLRVGDHRVFYELDEKGGRVIVHLVGHRSEIYET